jgi:hypothetical protein
VALQNKGGSSIQGGATGLYFVQDYVRRSSGAQSYWERMVTQNTSTEATQSARSGRGTSQ